MKIILHITGGQKEERDLPEEKAKQLFADWSNENIKRTHQLIFNIGDGMEKGMIKKMLLIKEESKTGDEKWEELERELKQDYSLLINTPPQERFDTKGNLAIFKTWCILNLGIRSAKITDDLIVKGRKYATMYFKRNPNEIRVNWKKVFPYMAEKEGLKIQEKSELLELISKKI